MKKCFFRKNLLKSLLAAAVIIPLTAVFSCKDIGLGEAVDVSAPTASISYPPVGAVIRGSFVLSGECTDDVLVTSVNVRVVNTNTGTEVYKGTASISGTTWQITLNNKDDGAYAKTNGWQYPDGTYEVTVWSNDDSGKSSGVSSRTLDIDNTPPFFIISKPGVTVAKVAAGTEPAAYGSTFSVSGTIADLHEISKMALDIYDKDGNPLTDSNDSNKAKNIYETSIATAGGTSVEFANTSRSAGDSVAYQRYITLYKDLETSTATKNFKCTVRLSDSAREYKNPGDSGTGEGNVTSCVYLYDDVYSAYLSSSKGLGLSASNLMQISNGTQNNGSLRKEDLKAKEVNTASFTNGSNETDSRLSFTLNPAANPTYTLSGLGIFGTKDDADALNKNQLANSSKVTASISAGLNNTAMLPKTVHAWIVDMTTKVTVSLADGKKTYDEAKVKEFAGKFTSALNAVAVINRGKMDPESQSYDANYTSDVFKTQVLKTVKEQTGCDDVWCVKDNTGSTASSSELFTLPFGMNDDGICGLNGDSLSTDLSNILKIDHYYLIALTGCDLDGLEFSHNSLFGFKGVGTGQIPKINVLSPVTDSVKTSAKLEKYPDGTTNGGLTFTGTAAIGDSEIDYIEYIIKVIDKSTNAVVGYKDGIKGKLEIKDGVQSKGFLKTDDKVNYTWEFYPAKCDGYDNIKCPKDKAYQYTVEFIAHDVLNQDNSITSTILVDSIKPVLGITAVTPAVENAESGKPYFVNGKINATFSARDNSDLDKVEYYCYASDKDKDIIFDAETGIAKVGGVEATQCTDNTGKFEGDDNQNKFGTTVTLDTTKITADEKQKNLLIVFKATDKVGNVTYTTRNFIVDQTTDRPKIESINFSDVKEEELGPDKNLFAKTSNNKMKFNVSDDDGTVSDISATAVAKGSSAKSINLYSNGAIDLSKLDEGIYTVTIVVKDANYKDDENTPFNKTEKSYCIAVSAGAPNIEIAESDKAFRKDDTVEVEVKLTNHSKSDTTVTLLRKADAPEAELLKNADYQDGKITIAAGASATFKDKFTVDATEDRITKKVVYTVKDSYEQTNSYDFSYVVDNKNPVVNITAVTPKVENTTAGSPYFVNGKINVTFNASDNYNLAKVEYYCFDGTDATNISIKDAENGSGIVAKIGDAALTQYKGSGTQDDLNVLSGKFEGDDSQDKFGKTVIIDTTKISANETQKNLLIVFKATDKANNVTYAANKFIVDQTTDRPTISPSNFSDGITAADISNEKGNLFGIKSNNKLMGSVADDDGIASFEVCYRKATSYNADGTAVFTGDFKGPFKDDESKYAENPTSVNISQVIPPQEGEGKFEIYFIVKDKEYKDDGTTPFNKIETGKYYVGVSNGEPKISLGFDSTYKTQDAYTRSYANKKDGETENPTITVYGNVSNKNSSDVALTTDLIKSVVRSDGADARDGTDTKTNILDLTKLEKQTADATAKTAFTQVIQPLGSDGESKTIKYIVTDVFGQTSEAEVTYTIDDEKPVFVNDTANTENNLKLNGNLHVETNWYKSDQLSIKGYFKDTGSGIEEVKCKLTIYEVSSDNPTQKTKNVVTSTINAVAVANNPGLYKFEGTITGLKPGKENYLELSAEDKCGNVSETTRSTIWLDKEPPLFATKFISVDNGASHSAASGSVTVNGRQGIMLYGTVSDALSGVSSVDATNILKFKIAGNQISYTGLKFTTETLPAEMNGESANPAYWTFFNTDSKFTDYSAIDDKTKITAWKASFDAITSNGSLSVECADMAKSSSENYNVLSFVVDKKAPVVTVRTSNKNVNGTLTIEGNVTEENTLSSMELYYATTLPEASIANEVFAGTKTLEAAGWTKFGTETITEVSKIYSWQYENFNFNKLSGAEDTADGKGSVYVLPVVKDSAGNNSALKIKTKNGTGVPTAAEGWNATEFTVDMNADRPTVQVANLDRKGKGTDSEPYTYILKYGTNAQIKGKISDDDALADKAVKVFIASKDKITSIKIPEAQKDTFPVDGTTYNITYGESNTAGTITYSKDNGWKRTVDVNGTSKTEITTLTGNDWTFTPADTEDGPKTVYFYLVDNKDSVFFTGNADKGSLYKPYFQFSSATAENSGNALNYSSDSLSPEIRSAKIYSYASNDASAKAVVEGGEAIGSTLIVGGKAKKYIAMELTGYDANQIDGFTLEVTSSGKGRAAPLMYRAGVVPSATGYTLNGNMATETASNTEAKWTTTKIDLTDWATGEVTVTVNVYDKSGLKGNGKYSFNIDNTAPQVIEIIPAYDENSKEEKTGSFSISGRASDSDTGRAGVEDVSFYVPKKGQDSLTDEQLASLTMEDPTDAAKTVTVWSSKTQFKESWKFNFTGEGGAYDSPLFDTYTMLDDAKNPVYAGTSDGSNIWTIPVCIKATDALGNFKIVRHAIKYNPDGDKPKVTFTYPTEAQYKADEDNESLGYAVLGSTIRVTGTVEIHNMDCNAVSDGVYVQIAKDVMKAKKALTLYKAAKDIEFTINGNKVTVKAGVYLKKSRIGTLNKNTDYTEESVAAGAEITGAQASVLKQGEDYIHEIDWAAAKDATWGSASYKYTTVRADTISTNDSARKNIGEWTDGSDAEKPNKSGFKTAEDRAAWWGIPATSTTSNWSIAINQKNELNPTADGETNNIAIRACAVNNQGKAGAWCEPYYIHIDNQAPVMEVKLRQYDVAFTGASSANSIGNLLVEKLYEPGMYLKGEWYIYVDITDESGVKDGSINVMGSSGVITEKYSKNNIDCYHVWIPVDKTATNLLTYKVSATDTDEGNPHTITSTYQVNVDNTAPVIGSIKTTTSGDNSFEAATANAMSAYNIKDSSKSFNINNSVEESGSGFERTVFYLIRKKTGAAYTINSASKQCILDPFSLDASGKPSEVKVETDGLTPIEVKQGDKTFTLYGKKIDGSQTSGSVIDHQKFYVSGTLNSHIRAGGLVYIGNVLTCIKSINGTTVELEEPTTTEATSATFIYAQVVDNQSSEGGSPTTDGYGYTFKYTDDGDGMPEKVDVASDGVNWFADIRSANLPDGPVTLIVMAFDKAGNVSCKEIDTNIANNAPRIAKVFLGTDINNDGTYQANEFEEYNWSINEYNQTVTSNYTERMALKTKDYVSGKKSQGNGSAFKIKNGLAVVPEIVGGNVGAGGSIGMVYSRTAEGSTSAINNADAVIAPVKGTVIAPSATGYTLPNGQYQGLTDSNNKFYCYKLENKDIAGLASNDALKNATEASVDGEGKKMSFTFWDETEEGIKGQSTQNAVLFVEDFTVDLIDGTKPVAKIHPFHWNSKTDNSIQKDANGNLLGHIELEEDLAGTKLEEQYGADPKVSGKIVLTGYAYDETRLSKVEITGTAGKFAPTNCVAEYKKDSTTGVVEWTSASNATEGWALKVTEKRAPDQNGHLVEWRLEVDTEKVSGVACTDLVLTVTAYDDTILATKNSSVPGTDATTRTVVYATDVQAATGKFYSTAAEAAAGSVATGKKLSTDIETCYEKAVADATNTNVYAYYTGTTGTYQMDVVPYVTEVITNLTSGKESNPSVYNRTALGKYPVAAGETIYIKGFNITTDATYEREREEQEGEFDKIPVRSVAVAADRTSGILSYKENNIEIINNLNNNDARGSYEGTTTKETGDYTVYSNYYNRTPNNDNNNRLTDDIDLDVWQINKQAARPISGVISDPVMKISPTSGMIGFAFTNGPLYFSMPGTLAAQARNDNGAGEYSYFYWQGSYDFMSSVGFAYDSTGHTYGCAAGGDINSTDADRFSFMTDRWGVSGVTTNGSYEGSNALRLEMIAQAGDSNGQNTGTINFDKQRIKSPSYATYRNGNATNIYMAYFDNLNGEIRFRAGTLNDNTGKTNFGNFNDTYTKKEVAETTDGGRYKTTYVQVVADSNGTNLLGKAGEYVSIGVTSDNKVVMVWYDSENDRLMYSYNSSPSTIRNGKNKEGWSDARTIFRNTGAYCQIAVDADNGIHIAAYSSDRGGSVKYAYLSSVDAAAKTCTVDCCGIVGENLTLDVAKENGKVVPHIGYYSNSSMRPKYAYLIGGISGSDTSVKTGSSSAEQYTGNWEISVVPTSKKIKQDRINVGVWKDNGGNLKNSVTGTSSADRYYGKCYGNGTKNAVIAYAANKSSTEGYIETAQKK